MLAFYLEQVSGLQALLRDLRTLPTGKLSKLLVAIHLGQKIDRGKAAFAKVNSLLVAAPKTCYCNAGDKAEYNARVKIQS